MATKTTKTVNYTDEQTAKVVADYAAGVTVETIAEALGKTTRSVIAKLSREGVYKAKEYKTKTGETPVKKDSLAEEMGELFGLSEGEVDSLTKANKTALVKIVARMKQMHQWLGDAEGAIANERSEAYRQGYEAGKAEE